MIYFLQGQSAGIVELRAMVSAIVIFLAIPKNVVQILEEDIKEQKENIFAREDVRILANYKIRDFADAFKKLSRIFSEGVGYREEILPEEIEEIYMDLSEKICADCVNCKFCWNKHREETKNGIHAIICGAGEESAAASVSPDFSRRCIRLPEYMEYAAERMAVVRMNLGWKNRMAENREIMARQMMDVSEALRSLILELDEYGFVTAEEKEKITDELKKYGVKVRQISAKRKRGRLEIAFSGCCKTHRCLTKTDIANALSQSAGVPMCPGRETRNVLSDEDAVMFFYEDTKYKALTGIARVAQSGETVSGDNYSFMELSSGEILMLLADGMGSGESAYRDSGSFLEVLEYMLEAGFEKKPALQMLNTLFVMNFDGRTFTTLDMVSIHLHTGICEIVKNGAAATFIKRKSRVETISSEALPVGVDMQAESGTAVTRLEEGDMVIMVSDGVIDGFGREQRELEKLIEELESPNPNDIANQILMHALAGSSKEAMDDMSVLAAGLWIKNPL
jgi:stage II sporulation protein E